MATTGTIKFFNEEKGYGFITDSTGQRDFFVHVTGFADEELKDSNIKEGHKVTFDIVETTRGSNATNVKSAE